MSTSEKLKENEKSLFRRVYLARIETGASVEAAEKQALHAVKRWDALGALNDDRPDPRDQEIARLREGIGVVRALLWDEELDLNLYDEALYDWLSELVAGTASQPLNAKMLRERLHKSNPSSKSNTPTHTERVVPHDAEIERLRDALVSYEGADQALTAILANHGLSDKPDVLAKEISTYEIASQSLGELSAMLALYGMPSEPKALAKELELLRKTNADELQRLRACFAVVREVLRDPNLDLASNVAALHEHLDDFILGKMSAETLREQFYSPDSGPRADAEAKTLATEMIDASIGPVGVAALRAVMQFLVKADEGENDMAHCFESLEDLFAGRIDAKAFIENLKS